MTLINQRGAVRLLSLFLLAVVLLGVAGACDNSPSGTSGTYQGGGDSEPWFR